jgi:hypothetical protein
MDLLSAAQHYAQSKGTTIVSHRIDGDKIIFVLTSGPKLTMTKDDFPTPAENVSVPLDNAPQVEQKKPKKGKP